MEFVKKNIYLFDVWRVYESNIKRNSSEQKNIHYVIYWIYFNNSAHTYSDVDSRLLR